MALAEAGMDLAITARTTAQLEEVASDLKQRTGRAVHVFPCDLADRPAVERLAGDVHAAFDGPPDVLVNNAGMFLEAPVDETDPARWEHLFRVNLTAPFLLCRAFLPDWKQQRRGTVINIASTSGLQGYIHQAAYCATKHGLVGFSRSLAMECRLYGIRVHVVCPGGVRTDFIAGSHVAERIRGQAILEPENIADLVLFLLRQPPNVDYPEVVVKRFQAG